MTSSSYTVHFVTVDIIDSNILVLKLYIIIIQIEEFMEQFMEYGSYMYVLLFSEYRIFVCCY